MFPASLRQVVTRCAVWLLAACGLLLAPGRASAIGWDNDDFLIGGGTGFLSKIGVFDHDLTFKGYLESNFITVAGMDFDAAGHLVAVASGNVRSVRVYDSSGAIVGGFTRNDDLLGTSNDLKTAPSGDYVVATQNFGGGDGARQFATDGSFVRQYASGRVTAVSILPGNLLWVGGIGTGPISVFDVATGVPLGTVSVATVNSINSMTYSSASNSVLIATIGNRVVEASVTGDFIRTFTAPSNVGISAVTRGPDGDVFATAADQTVLRWHADGQFVAAVSTASALGGASGIVWAGVVPEPELGVSAAIAVFLLWRRVRSG